MDMDPSNAQPNEWTDDLSLDEQDAVYSLLMSEFGGDDNGDGAASH